MRQVAQCADHWTGVDSRSGNAPLTQSPSVFVMIDSFRTGGTERQFVTLVRSLDPTAFQVHLGCLQATGGFYEGFSCVPEFRLGGSLYKLRSWKARWLLSRHLRECGAAIAHAFDFYTNLTLIPAARIARVPVVFGSHRQVGDLLTAGQFQAQALVFRWCNKVICNSRAAASKLLACGLDERKIAIIGNGIEETAFARTQPALPRVSGVLRIGMIARMNARYKNHEMFLRAAAWLCQRFSELKFLLVGEGPLRLELEQLVEALRIKDRVQFLGERFDITAILASLDMVVIPSASESMSNVALESMAAGVPVVATNVGGNPELLSDDRGVLFPAGNETALCLSLERLLRDEGLRSWIGGRARRFAEANFKAKYIVKQYEELYFEELQRGTRWSRKNA